VLDGWRWFMGHFARVRQAHYSQAPPTLRFERTGRDGVLDWWSNGEFGDLASSTRLFHRQWENRDDSFFYKATLICHYEELATW